MKYVNVILKYSGLVCIPMYIVFTFISHLFNTRINPLTNWLSDFGNPFENPSGALFYNMGCIIIAALLVVFYIGMYQWYKGKEIEKKYVICYVCAQIFGIISSAFLVLASIFTLGPNTALHSNFGTLHMIGLDLFLSFTAVALFMNPSIKKWIGVFAYLIAVFNIMTTNAFSLLYIAEWIYFLLFMIFIVILTFNYDKLLQHAPRPGKQDVKDGSKVSL